MEFKNRMQKKEEPCDVDIVVDRMRFSGPVDVTDPCYDRDVWCRLNDLQIEDGDYECVAVLSDEGEWGKRIQKTGIYLDGVIPSKKSMEIIGNIGVDAGLAGFFMHKPDYSDDEWRELCEECADGCAWTTDEGFFSESGYGDGGYNLYGHYSRNGLLDALELVFIN